MVIIKEQRCRQDQEASQGGVKCFGTGSSGEPLQVCVEEVGWLLGGVHITPKGAKMGASRSVVLQFKQWGGVGGIRKEGLQSLCRGWEQMKNKERIVVADSDNSQTLGPLMGAGGPVNPG